MGRNTKPRRLTFGQICELQPLLRQLVVEAATVDGKAPDYDTERVWYGRGNTEGLRGRMVELLDGLRLPAGVSEHQVYDTVYDALYDLLPPDHEPVDDVN